MAHLKQLHSRAIRLGLSSDNDAMGRLIKFCAVSENGDLSCALQLFDQMPQPDAFIYNTIMRGLFRMDVDREAGRRWPVLVLTVGLITFAWSTILGWSYYGERAWVYLCGVKAIKPFRVAWTLVVFVGCVAALDVVWNVADTLNACMAFPNCIALLGLSGVIASETKKYVWDKDAEMGGLMKWMDDVAPQIDK